MKVDSAGMALPRKIKKITEELIKGLQNFYGNNLVSVILYGSAASGEYARRRSNVNIAVILNDTSLSSLAKCSRLLNKRKFLIINPVFFTEDYIKRSVDVFPIEFIDMKENHVLLYGKDILNEITIDIKNLRFQCEQEIKSKIINIKRQYLRAESAFMLKNILFKSLTSTIHILRNLIRLKGSKPSYTKEEALKETAKQFGIDVTPLQKTLDAKNGNLKLSHQEIDRLVACLVEILENISDKVDHF